ncbi:hypothetical protein EYF80_036012 [Liparis tanakae]|uniref:Uncharacterized protein n=1 Tax=Liparis tanakae TaxID=230148 RepID=A0A4Z2GKF7_9TELE|nr:hypothetical protein EYF80_036012 [Liparis tanakae]
MKGKRRAARNPDEDESGWKEIGFNYSEKAPPAPRSRRRAARPGRASASCEPPEPKRHPEEEEEKKAIQHRGELQWEEGTMAGELPWTRCCPPLPGEMCMRKSGVAARVPPASRRYRLLQTSDEDGCHANFQKHLFAKLKPEKNCLGQAGEHADVEMRNTQVLNTKSFCEHCFSGLGSPEDESTISRGLVSQPPSPTMLLAERRSGGRQRPAGGKVTWPQLAAGEMEMSPCDETISLTAC